MSLKKLQTSELRRWISHRSTALKEPARCFALALVVGMFAGATPATSAWKDVQGSSDLPKVLGPHRELVDLVVGDDALDLIDALFLDYDPGYLDKIATRERRFNALAERLFARAADGRDVRCSQQIFLEAKWLVNYTAWWSRIDARLDDLEASFAKGDQSFAVEPSPGDGFYGRCTAEKFIRIEYTLLHYFDMAGRGELPSVERTPLRLARSKAGLTSFAQDHLISDIPKTGEDFRSRLGGLASIFAAAEKRDPVMEMVRSTVRGPDLTPAQQDELRAHFNRLLDAWQDPESGYWGAWYRDGERIFKTTDLSITYHIVHARRGNVGHWPALIRTTFAIRDQAYPFGWLSDGHWTNHNNYDLARLFRYGWPHMTDLQRREAARALQDMVNWSFAETVRPGFEGFRPDPKLSSSLGAEFYFGASFLVAAGFFDAEPWFGTIERPAPADEVCLGMMTYGRTLDGPLVAGAMNKLENACRPHLL
jgi:hypothetical protein